VTALRDGTLSAVYREAPASRSGGSFEQISTDSKECRYQGTSPWTYAFINVDLAGKAFLGRFGKTPSPIPQNMIQDLNKETSPSSIEQTQTTQATATQKTDPTRFDLTHTLKASEGDDERVDPEDGDAAFVPDLSASHFAEHRLGVAIWPKIQEIFDAVERGERKILVRSCNGAGKTTALAALCNWKLSQFPDTIVLTTASSWVQVARSLWGEIRRQARHATLYDKRDITTTEIKLDDKHFAIGLSPSVPENAQGFHAPNMLIAVDEATGVRHEIVDALWGNATGSNAQMVMIYNPIDAASFPFEAEETGDWHVITISAFEHPNVIEGNEQIPGAVTREWIEDRLRAWSYEVDPASIENADSESVYVPWLDKYYRKTERVATRICGEWPMESGEGFIEPSLISRSLNVEPVSGIKSLGVDIARSGNDRTVFAFFDGNIQLGFESYFGKDLMRTANRIKQLFDEGWTSITLDDTGIGGGVTDRLRELGVPVIAVNFAQSAKGFIKTKAVANARAEMYFLLESELRACVLKLVKDKELEQELVAMRLKISSNGSYLIEDKQTLSARLGRSPDKSDATALARYGLRLSEYSNRPKFIRWNTPGQAGKSKRNWTLIGS
jgi:phage terminase large subunit